MIGIPLTFLTPIANPSNGQVGIAVKFNWVALIRQGFFTLVAIFGIVGGYKRHRMSSFMVCLSLEKNLIESLVYFF